MREREREKGGRGGEEGGGGEGEEGRGGGERGGEEQTELKQERIQQ